VLTGGAKHDGSSAASHGHLAPDGASTAMGPATPRRQGTSSSLSNPVSPQQNINPDLERQRLDFEAQVTDPALLDSDDDPLEVHYRYIRWLLEHYTTGHNSNSKTLNVIERTLEIFKRDGRSVAFVWRASPNFPDKPTLLQIQERPEAPSALADLQGHGQRSARCVSVAAHERHSSGIGRFLRGLGRLS
jgi:hypothetical protein